MDFLLGFLCGVGFLLGMAALWSLVLRLEEGSRP
jgi:hypothetical protein